MDSIKNNSIFINKNYTDFKSSSGEDDEQDIKLEDISIMYTTEKKEEDRSTFDATFKEVPLDQTPEGKKFLNGLISNKNSLMKDLNLESEEYDNLACIALALASQETGMGEEKGYDSENKGILSLFRKFAKLFDDSSASSGLTQMKIYDFLNSDKPLTDKEKAIIKKYGITAKGKSTNNLYKNPDKSAVATMVILSSISNNYDNYKNTLASEHEKLEKEFKKNGITPADALKKGENILDNIVKIYDNIDESKTQSKFRETLKQFFLSQNNSRIGDKGVDKDYNEEIQLNKLNDLISKNNSDFKLNFEDLNYMRYALTAENQEMTQQEYCAYGWNKGTGTTGMQIDRLLADKVGTILATPENFDYDQFTVNVNTLAIKYANQSLQD